MSVLNEEIDRDDVQLIPVGPRFALTSVDLSMVSKPSFDEFSGGLKRLIAASGSIALWIGDMLNLGESLFHEEVWQAIDSEHISLESARNYAWVAKRVNHDVRALAPSWSHLQAVASLTPPQQLKWMQKAAEGEDGVPWSVSKLETELKAAKVGGKTALRFFLVVDCGNEGKQTKLADELEKEGYTVVKRSGINKVQKKAKVRGKAVTARRRRAPKINQKRHKKG